MKKIFRDSGYLDRKVLRRYYENEAELYSSKREVMYSKKMHFQRQLWNKRIECIRKNVLSGKSFLDVGCSEGYYLKAIIELLGPGTFCVGVDISETYLKKARMTGRGEFVLADAEFLSFKDCSFELVVLSEIMEHLPTPISAFQEALRVTSKYLVITTPRRSIFRRILDGFGFKKDPFMPGSGHISDVSFNEIVKWTKDCGGKIIDSEWDCYLPNGLINLLHLPDLFVKCVNKVWRKIPYFNREFPILQLYVIEKP